MLRLRSLPQSELPLLVSGLVFLLHEQPHPSPQTLKPHSFNSPLSLAIDFTFSTAAALGPVFLTLPCTVAEEPAGMTVFGY